MTISTTTLRVSFLSLLLALFVSTAHAGSVTSVLFDDYSGGGGNLPGSSPDIGAAWTGSTLFKDNGTVPAAAPGTVYSTVSITSGAVYTLQGFLNPTNALSPTDWFALGFTGTAGSGTASINGEGATAWGWMLLRQNGQTQAFNGPDVANLIHNDVVIDNPSVVQVVLDTRNASNYTLQYFNENVALGPAVAIGSAPSITQVALSTLNQTGNFDTVLLNREVASTGSGTRLLLTDDFTSVGTPSNADLNYNLHNRQTGDLALQTWGRYGNAQVGNSDSGDKTILDGGNVLLLNASAQAEINRNLNGSDSAGGLLISFDVAPDVQAGNVNTENWVAINLGADPNTVPGVNGVATHFGLLFRENGDFQAFDGSTPVGAGTFASTALEDMFYENVRLILSDPTDGNPFDGSGQTTIQAFYEGSQFYTYTKGSGGYANNFINFSGFSIGYIDNLQIIQIPEPSSIVFASIFAVALICGGYCKLRRNS